MKTVLALVLVTTITSCGKKITNKDDSKSKKIETITNDGDGELNEQIVDEEVIDEPIVDEGQEPVDEVFEGDHLKINATLIKFDESRKLKMEKALKLLGEIINSEEFEQEVLKHIYLGDNAFRKNNDLTNQQILESIMRGSEEQFLGDNSTVDLRINLYYSRRNVVGYTYPSKLDIYVNKKYFDKYKLSSIAANLMHEWLHKLGYGHSYSYSSLRKYSVPYAIGSIVRELGEKLE